MRNRISRNLMLLAGVMAAAVGTPSAARAGHDSPLHDAARQYRDAVRDFERDVRRADYFNRYDEKLVDDLEDATGHLRSAARHPDKIDRLLYRWDEVRSLQPRVERAIFGRRCYPPHPPLARSWDHVWAAYDALAREMRIVSSHRPFCAAPEVCNGQCGYHEVDEHRRRHPGPRTAPPGGYGLHGEQSRPGHIKQRERLEARVRWDEAFENRDENRTLAVPHVDRRHPPR